MASFGDSFLDMAEAMLGRSNRSSSFEVLSVPCQSTRNVSSELKRTCSDDNDISTSSYNSNPENDGQIKRSVVAVTPLKRRRITRNHAAVETVHALNRAMTKVSAKGIGQYRTAFFHCSDEELHTLMLL
jgi:hypothetical protein